MRISSFFANVSGLVLAVAMSGVASPALAQGDRKKDRDADKATDTVSTEAIVVTGVRGSVVNAVNTKRRAEQIVDSISAQDIGALPDRSVAETLQRIPGVALTRTQSEFTTGRPTDPGRLAPEGGGVTIRGLTGSLSQSNGRDIFSAGNGRTLDWSDISSDLIAGVDVYKNPSADLTEGGISGIINLRGRKPFDQAGQLISMSSDVSYGDLQKKWHWSGNALYSNRWDAGDGGEIGILLAGSINNKGTRTDSIQAGTYGPYTLAAANGDLSAGTTVYRPASIGYRTIDWFQRRVMLDGVLQISPSPDMTFTFEAAYSKATPHEVEFANLAYSGPPAEDSSWRFGPNNTVIAGSNPATNLDLDTRVGRYKLQARDFSINWKYAPEGTPWTFNVDAQRLSSSSDVYSMTAFTEFGDPTYIVDPQRPTYNPKRPTMNFDLGSNPHMFLTVPPGGYALDQQSSYWWTAAMDHIEHNTAGQWAYRADVDYAFEDSFLKSISVGARLTDRAYHTKQSTYNWGLLSHAYWGGGAPVYLNENASPGLSSQSMLHAFDNFFHGNVPAPGVGWFPTPELLSTGANTYSYLHATESAGWGWSPLTGYQPYDINNQYEKTKAAYALLRFGSDDGPLGRFEGNLGVRVVQTRYNTVSTLRVSGIQATPNGCRLAHPTDPSACTAIQNAYDFLGADPATPVSGGATPGPVFTNKYTNVLPSLNLNFHLNDRLQWRFAAGKSMIRPDFHQTSPVFSLGWNFDNTGAVSAGLPAFTGTAATPGLKPMTSWQGDTSIEYYWGKGNALTLALFYKDIADQITTTAYISNITFNGVTLPFNFIQNINSNKHAKIKGFELGYTQFFDFLPGLLGGLGVQGNFTYVDATGGLNSAYNASLNNATAVSTSNLPYEQLSKYQYNVAALYSKYGIDARLAYNWRSHYLLTTISAGNFAPTWMEDYGQLDGSLFYNVTENIKVGVQVTNILGNKTYLSGSVLNNGNVLPFRAPTQVTDKDRVMDFAVRVRF